MSDSQNASEKESVEATLRKARQAIERGEVSLKWGIEKMADAERLGRSQREIAKAVGKSASWVNRMLKWRERGYRDDTPFGPQAKETRRRKARVEATEQAKEEPAGSKAVSLLRANPIWTPGPVKEEEQIPEAAPAGRAPSNCDSSRQAGETHKKAIQRRFGISQVRRQLLLEALDGLAAFDTAERAKAASWVEKCRSNLNLSWHELIVPATADDAAVKAA